MKNKYISTLLCGLLATGFALASDPGYSLTTSSNLAVTYSYNSGFFIDSWNEQLDRSNYLESTSSNILGIYQNASTGQWFQTTEHTRTYSYDDSFRNVQRTILNSYAYTESTGPGDQWIEMNLSINSPMNYSVWANASYGSKTSPRGFTQIISPALGTVVDGQASSGNWQNIGEGYNGGSAYGAVNKTFQASVEATDGGSINFLQVYLSSDFTYGVTFTEHVSYSDKWTTDTQIIYAPVPEPESYAMLLAGLGLMGGIARRRNRKI